VIGHLRRPLVAAATTLTLLASSLLTAPEAQAMDFDGYLQESIAGRTSELDDIIFHRQTMNVKLTERKGRDFMFRFEVDLYLDGADFMDDTPRSSSRLREGYLRFGLGDLDLRVGRVQIAWGEAEGVVVSDQVSPFDLENFIVPKFDEIRLGVDGVFGDYYFANGDDLQLLWISHFESPNFPDRNSPWAFIDEDEITGVGATLEDLDEPTNQFKNSELGIRYSGHPIAADWAVGYLWSWDDRPSLFQQVGSVTPTIERFHLFTANIVAPVGDYLLKFDTAYEMNRYLSTNPQFGIDPDTISDGLRIKTDVWRGLLGLEMKPDVPYWEQAEASFQFVHEHVMDDHFALAQAEDSNLVSMRLSAAYLNEQIKPWLFAIYGLQGDNWWMQAKVDWEPRDAIRFSIEYDLFEGHAYDGDTGGNFGNFDRNDMVQLTARYTF
jgi:hypothetical protein